MKKINLLTALIVVLFNTAFAQNDVDIAGPAGYTIPQFRSVKGIAIDQTGNVWIPFSLFGLAKYDGTTWTVYDSLNSGLLNNKMLSVATNSSGVWAGSDTGLYNYDGNTWNRMTVASAGLFSDTITKLYSPGGSDLYTINNTGFSHYNGSTWVHYNTSNSGLVNDTVQCLFKDASGNLWVGTKNGLSRFDGNAWQNFTTANSEIQSNNIRSLTEDAGNFLYIGTASHFINLYDGTDFIPLRIQINSYYNLPYLVNRMFRLQNGSVLHSSFTDDFMFGGNPVSALSRDGFGASDTNTYAAIDASDRIWKINRLISAGHLFMRDSLMNYPENPVPQDYNDLDINEVRCGMFNNNAFHWDVISTAKYEVPKGSGVNAMFASALWIGGLDPGGNLHIGAQTYRQSGNDFWPGPLDTITATIDSATMAQFDTTWKINRHTIDEFITEFGLGNVSNGNYPVPGIIASWPAHGPGSYSRKLAPFVDVNADGVYNPYDGDYPDMKGDQMLWWVMNDNVFYHNESDGMPLGIEIHASAYAYSCDNIADSNEAVNYTTFYSFDIINRSDTDYHDVYLGMFADVDLGNYLDDYVACNVDQDIGMVYNGDNLDESLINYGIGSYGENPPMMSVAVLSGPLAEPGDQIDNNHDGTIDEPGEVCMLNHFMYYNNNNDPVSGNPAGPDNYYGYLRSIWRNGNHLTFGGNGYGGGIGATLIPVNYMYSGMPHDTGWTEVVAGNLPEDRRMLLSSGPFNLSAGETISAEYAYVFTRDESAPNGINTSVAKNFADVERIKRWFETDSFPCNNSGVGIVEAENDFDFTVYPNPATGWVTINLSTLHGGQAITGTAKLELYDMMGQKLKSYTFPPGRKELKINSGNFTAGIYFLKLINSESYSTKKIVVKN